MMGSEKKKARRRKSDIVIESTEDILNYFADRYNELSGPQQNCGVLFLEMELNRGNIKTEAYLQGIAMGKLDAHPQQAWALKTLIDFKKRAPGTRKAVARHRLQLLRTRASQIGLQVYSEKYA